MRITLLIFALASIGCDKTEAPCCKTVINMTYHVSMQEPYLGGKFWRATYMDCKNNVTNESVSEYPSDNPPLAIGQEICE
jgi:hypothetical protein